MSGTPETAPKPTKVEVIKEASNYLRGTILEGLADDSTGAIAPDDTQLTKFHGIYQQDDRDLRKERRQQKLERAFYFMIRVRVPGGICTPAQKQHESVFSHFVDWIAGSIIGDGAQPNEIGGRVEPAD